MINMQLRTFKTDYFCLVFKLYKTDGAFVGLLIIQLKFLNVVLHSKLFKILNINLSFDQLQFINFAILFIYEMTTGIMYEPSRVHGFVVFVTTEKPVVVPKLLNNKILDINQVPDEKPKEETINRKYKKVVKQEQFLIGLILHVSDMIKVFLLFNCQFPIEFIVFYKGYFRWKQTC